MSKDHTLAHNDNHFKVCLLCCRRTKKMFFIKKLLTAAVEKVFLIMLRIIKYLVLYVIHVKDMYAKQNVERSKI